MKNSAKKSRSDNGTSSDRVGIVVDNPYRDLPAMTLLARELAEGGAEVYLIPWNRASEDVWPIAPDVFVMNYLRANNEKFTEQLFAAGIRVVVLDTEGSVFSPVPRAAHSSFAPKAVGLNAEGEDDTLPAMEEYALTMARSAKVRRGVARYCSWNRYFADYAVQAGWYDREQIVVTGTPRMDFYAPRWRGAALEIAHYAEPFRRPLVLINGSFPLANPAFQTPDREVEMMVKYFGYAQEYVRWWQGTQVSALRGLTRLANELARRFPDVDFVFRPHPFEGQHVYRFTLDTELSNLHFEKAGTVDGWLLRASALIHWGSSTAIEGAVADVPVLTPGWIPQHLPVPLVDDLNIVCADSGEVARHLEGILSGSFVMPDGIAHAKEEVVARTYDRIDGAAYKRVADEVWWVLKQKGPRRSFQQCRRFAYGDFPGLGARTRLAARIRRWRGAGVHWSLRHLGQVEPGPIGWDSSGKQFGPLEVERIVRAIERAGFFEKTAQVERPVQLHFGHRAGRSIRLKLVE